MTAALSNKKLRVYIAGPYTQGDPLLNIRAAIQAGDVVLKSGHTPFIPHMNYTWHLLCPHEPSTWYQWDLEWLEMCDGLIRLPGESWGADREVEFAQGHGIPVYTLEEFLVYYTLYPV